MARYTGPKTRISRIFGEPILGNGKYLTKNSFPPGQHGNSKKRKAPGEYALQLKDLIKLLESRLDNTIFRLGVAPSRPAARQLVAHKHVTVNGEVVNIPSYRLKAGDMVSLKDKSRANTAVTSQVRGKNPKFNWLDWNETELTGTFITYPERESVPENIKEQLIVELYSK